MTSKSVSDLAGVVYSSGKVFDGLQTGRVDTEEFLRTGNTSRINSMHDLALLRDLKAVANLVIEHKLKPIDVDFIIQLNSTMTRSASIEPGALRQDADGIGVGTAFGRHEPPAVTYDQLSELVIGAMMGDDHDRSAARLFLAIAKAQPFKDGNKRTGIFAANALLLNQGTGKLLTVPFSDVDEDVARRFSEKLARSYIFDEDDAVIQALIEEGITEVPMRSISPPAAEELSKVEELKARIARRAAEAARDDQ